MRFHIVRTNETVEEILFLYSLNKAELIEDNKHVRFWDRLVPGTKLKIPAIPEVVNSDIENMEPFIEDYYPKKKYNFNEEVVAVMPKDDIQETVISNVEQEQEMGNIPLQVEKTPEEQISDQIPSYIKIDVPEEIKRMQRDKEEYEEGKRQSPFLIYPSSAYYYTLKDNLKK